MKYFCVRSGVNVLEGTIVTIGESYNRKIRRIKIGIVGKIV